MLSHHVHFVTSFSQVLLFLKSSDRIAHDICSPFDASSSSVESLEFVLSLSKFYNLMPHSEFRCFVKCDRLVGISQRDISQFFPQVVGEAERIRHLCSAWFAEHLRSQFSLPQCHTNLQ